MFRTDVFKKLCFSSSFVLIVISGCSQSLVLVGCCGRVLQEKLSSFRIKELKDVLTQLGLSKQGKKQVIIFLLIVFVALTGQC